MPKKRADGEGMIRKRPDGKWEGRTPRDAQGKRRKVVGASQREVLDRLKILQKTRDQGVDITAKQPTVEQFTDTWLEQVVKRSKKISTYTNYKNVLRYYVVPHIGTLTIDKLTAARVQQLVNDLIDEGYAGATVRNAYLRLRAMLTVAVQYRLIPYNPALSIALPKLDKDQKSLTFAETIRLRRALEGERHALLYDLYVLLGLRRGEGLGLLWRDFDADAATIKISQQVQDFSGTTAITLPKNDKMRTLPLTPSLVIALQEHWKNQQIERKRRDLDWKEHGLIFPSEVGTPIGPRNLARQFAEAVARAGLEDVHLHTLRHTCATLLGEFGTEERVIGALLGHSTKTITAHYAKSTMPMIRTAISQLEHVLIKKAA